MLTATEHETLTAPLETLLRHVDLLGSLWIAEVVLGNVGGARAHAIAPPFALAAVAMTGMAGLVSASESGSFAWH